MKKFFDILGYFYEKYGRKCRKYLDLKRKAGSFILPDLFLVIMNPGKSKPEHENEYKQQEWVKRTELG